MNYKVMQKYVEKGLYISINIRPTLQAMDMPR